MSRCDRPRTEADGRTDLHFSPCEVRAGSGARTTTDALKGKGSVRADARNPFSVRAASVRRSGRTAPEPLTSC